MTTVQQSSCMPKRQSTSMMTSTMTAMMTWVEAEQMALQMLKVPLLPLLCLGCLVTLCKLTVISSIFWKANISIKV